MKGQSHHTEGGALPGVGQGQTRKCRWGPFPRGQARVSPAHSSYEAKSARGQSRRQEEEAFALISERSRAFRSRSFIR